MSGIKDLVGLLFWMDNKSMPAMKAVSDGERCLTKQKLEIMQHLNREFHSNHFNGKNKSKLPRINKPMSNSF
jgi:hypothetical protein